MIFKMNKKETKKCTFDKLFKKNKLNIIIVSYKYINVYLTKKQFILKVYL